MNSWISNAVFYHIYPLGFCGAPQCNDPSAAPVERLAQVEGWLDHIQSLGANALYLGPLFESTAHGYDTADYYWVDRRLGSNATLAHLSDALHRRGMRLVLDGVFNHVGRDFWAFRDVQANGQASPYCGWFNLRWDRQSPYGDRFWYEGWNNHYDLVKLNLSNPDARNHLLGAVESWVRDYAIDGLRLDAADCLDFDFLRALSAFCRDLKPDFWLMGEIIHGDYRRWANPEMLDSVTNYECYKGLWSSLADKNMFEIAYAFNRQSGPGGLYRDLLLYNFADNHDVDRVASNLKEPRHLFPLYCMLFTMPGVPSIYYGSEWGIAGKRTDHSDAALRPALNLDAQRRSAAGRELTEAIARLSALRSRLPALQRGTYRQAHVAAEQFAFERELDGERMLVAINGADQPVKLKLRLADGVTGTLEDELNPGAPIPLAGGQAEVELYPAWARVFRVRA